MVVDSAVELGIESVGEFFVTRRRSPGRFQASTGIGLWFAEGLLDRCDVLRLGRHGRSLCARSTRDEGLEGVQSILSSPISSQPSPSILREMIFGVETRCGRMASRPAAK